MRDDLPSRRLPTINPGEIWIIEHDPASELSALDRDALTNANAVIYDRALAPLVALVLPMGAYAEPLPFAERLAGPAISPRAFELAQEGWSVVQLVEPRPERRRRMHLAPPTLLRATAGELPILVIAKTANDRHRQWDACLNTLPELIGELDEDNLLTLVFGPIAAPYPTRTHAFTANGLAG
jgi:hypothetical protein